MHRVHEALIALRDDLATGVWNTRNGYLRNCAEFDGGLRVVIIEP
jgi:hypothetical protein